MTKKVFISYSHKDEAFRDALDEHLSSLRINGIINDWHDRKIVPGQDWDSEISKNLQESEVIIFLVSSSFLASGYCMELEAKKAMEMHENSSAILIPIVVRACDWAGHEFSKCQGLPKDTKPVASWDNEDEAWLDVVNGLKKYLSSFSPIRSIKNVPSSSEKISLNSQVYEWLDDTEVVLTHRKVDKVKLSDIYVTIDFAVEGEVAKNEMSVVSSSSLKRKKGFYLVSGEEQQGKTSLLKDLFKYFALSKKFVIYVDAKDIKSSDLNQVIQRAAREQYIGLEVEGALKECEIIFLLDNLDEIGLNQKFRSRFLKQVNDELGHVVITCHSSFSYVTTEIPELDNYIILEMLGLGHQRRAELVEKWISLGVEESIDDEELYSKCDELKERLDTVIRKNIVPAKPVYVLMLLQMFEAYAQQNLDLTSHGHCYQQLVYKSFDQAKIPPSEISKYINVLTELSWEIHKNGKGLNAHQLDRFFLGYGKTYLPVDQSDVVDRLRKSLILTDREYRVEFKYQYLFYFFVARKIAESYSTDKSIRDEVQELLRNLHREDYANILVFVNHHTKESWVLDEIKGVLSGLFNDDSPAELSKSQLSFMDEFIAQIPELIIEQREIREEREKHNKKLDFAEREKVEVESEDFESLHLLANINKTFKGMEIAGQIIRNRHASLTRDSLYDLASHGALTGLRFLNYFINISDVAKSEIIRIIEKSLMEHPNLTDDDIQASAKNAYLHLTYGVIDGVVKKIAASIGSKEAGQIYDLLESNENTPAITLLKQAIELKFSRSLDVQKIEMSTRKLKDNPVCSRILKEMVIQHIYMFPVDYKVKQQLANLLSISVRGQRLMDIKKLGKGAMI
ncbi:toll/interleukin-1 receptor domain-containing protein [Marinobacterium arenosum]|uniref:toll/interleukin-1 receptor domain-containing protein n=1 Tax=Marinobacterium arenosum TaxID=2862496 RepID=UPI001C974FDB|nr:toll/interleukin-1 receptor domain-containing protein [Marinobacterium arenosum]MBY4675209.1 toll/interleukin-1 receptor domain-containing protein [Marinobacterium arenosum]